MNQRIHFLSPTNPNSSLIFDILISLSLQKVLYHQMVPLPNSPLVVASQILLLRDVIPSSEKTITGSNALIQGVECGILNVPLHVVNLKSDFVNGPVTVGVMHSYQFLVFNCCLVITLLEIILWLIHL